MRLKFKTEFIAPYGTQKTYRQFLWFPKELPAGSGQGCETEIRWLEWAGIRAHVGRSILGEHKWYDDYWVEEVAKREKQYVTKSPVSCIQLWHFGCWKAHTRRKGNKVKNWFDVSFSSRKRLAILVEWNKHNGILYAEEDGWCWIRKSRSKI